LAFEFDSLENAIAYPSVKLSLCGLELESGFRRNI